jgi:hypothetical protein
LPGCFFGAKENINLGILLLTIVAILAVLQKNTEVALAAIGAILSISGKSTRLPKK